jgi:large subunit ribosomal protein L35
VPKMKTHKGTRRRLKITATGKILRAAGNKRHLKFGKAKRTLQADDKMVQVTGGHRDKVRRLLPYAW